jgi:NitT/TauT family transport system substrate-binding protein
MRRLWAVTFVVVGALLAGAACGGGGSDGTSTGGASSSGAPIKFGYSAWPGWFPWQVAEEAGIFKDAGVNVELVWFEGYLDSINAFASGQLDGNSQTLNDTVASVAAGSDQVIVLVNDNSTGNDQIIATREVQTVQDLRGKRVGVEVGVVDHFLLLQGLRKAGLTAADVQIVNLETGAAAAAFASGQLDAVGVFAPFTTQALKRDGSHTLFTSKDYPGSISDHLVISRKLVTDRPADVQKIVDAWFKTLDYMKANPEKAVDIMAKRAGVSKEEYRSYEAGTTIFTLAQNVEAFGPGSDFKSLPFAAKEITAFLKGDDLIKQDPDLTRIFEPRFVRASK